MSLDLHGYPVHDAWKEFKRHVSDCYHYKYKYTIVITGHGKIAQELPNWCVANPYIRHFEQMTPNTGAYKLTFWKQK